MKRLLTMIGFQICGHHSWKRCSLRVGVMQKFRAPNLALVISLIALFVALGGTTYAATSLPANSVATKQLKKNAVTSRKIEKRAVTAVKINTAGLTVREWGVTACYAGDAANQASTSETCAIAVS